MKLFPHILFEKHVYFFSTRNDQSTEQPLCQLYRHTFVPYVPAAGVRLPSEPCVSRGADSAPDPLDFDINFSHIITVAPRVEIQVGKGLNLLALLDIK